MYISNSDFLQCKPPTNQWMTAVCFIFHPFADETNDGRQISNGIPAAGNILMLKFHVKFQMLKGLLR